MSYYSSKIKTIFMPYELHLKVNPTQVHVEGSLEPLSKKKLYLASCQSLRPTPFLSRVIQTRTIT